MRLITSPAREYLPQAELLLLDSPREFLTRTGDDLDGLVYSAESGSAWTLIYLAFSVGSSTRRFGRAARVWRSTWRPGPVEHRPITPLVCHSKRTAFGEMTNSRILPRR